MKLTMRYRVALVGAAGGIMFVIGAGAAACVSGPPPAATARPNVRPSPSAPIVLKYSRAHPDPAVSGEFSDKIASGEIAVLIEEPREHASASFGPRKVGYALTIDPDLIKDDPTRDDMEDVLSILSHEHAHYRQYAEEEMLNYQPRGGRPMTEAQCTLTILVEIDAHGKACRDSRKYGWTSRGAKGACARTPVTIAEFFLRERLGTRPECRSVWEFFAGREPPKAAARPKTRPSRLPKSRSGPIYMPPP